MNLRLLFTFVLTALPLLATAAERPNYAGRYVLATPSPDRTFKLSLTQNGSRVHAIFYAADAAEPGTAPVGEGEGRVNDEGVLEFKFKDNLANKGTATLARANNLYRFELRVTTVADTAPLHFYGVLTMRKVGDSPGGKPAGAM